MSGKAVLLILLIVVGGGFGGVYYFLWPVKAYDETLTLAGLAAQKKVFNVYGFRNQMHIKLVNTLNGGANITILDPHNNTIFTHIFSGTGGTSTYEETIDIALTGNYQLLVGVIGSLETHITITVYNAYLESLA